jgi:putative FmdB family regulatory protein
MIVAMPTYVYQCEKCDQQFELVQSMTDKPIEICPKNLCRRKSWGKGRVKRQIGTGAGLIFKGSGFYATDYRSENYKASAKKENTAKSDSASEAKPSSPDKSPAGSPATATKIPSTEKSKPAKTD